MQPALARLQSVPVTLAIADPKQVTYCNYKGTMSTDPVVCSALVAPARAPAGAPAATPAVAPASNAAPTATAALASGAAGGSGGALAVLAAVALGMMVLL